MQDATYSAPKRKTRLIAADGVARAPEIPRDPGDTMPVIRRRMIPHIKDFARTKRSRGCRAAPICRRVSGTIVSPPVAKSSIFHDELAIAVYWKIIAIDVVTLRFCPFIGDRTFAQFFLDYDRWLPRRQRQNYLSLCSRHFSREADASEESAIDRLDRLHDRTFPYATSRGDQTAKRGRKKKRVKDSTIAWQSTDIRTSWPSYTSIMFNVMEHLRNHLLLGKLVHWE